MTKVVVTQIQRGTPESVQGFHYAVEVRGDGWKLIHRWTFINYEKAMEERKRVAEWYYLPTSVLPDAGVVAT